MSLQTTLEALNAHLRKLDDAVAALHVTATEDRPAGASPALVDRLENQVSDVLGHVEGALEHAEAAAAAFESENIENAIAHLFRAHQLSNVVVGRCRSELSAHDGVADLLQMGRERGRQWLAWSRVVKSSIDACTPLLSQVETALAECWRGSSERFLSHAVSESRRRAGRSARSNLFAQHGEGGGPKDPHSGREGDEHDG